MDVYVIWLVLNAKFCMAKQFEWSTSVMNEQRAELFLKSICITVIALMTCTVRFYVCQYSLWYIFVSKYT